MSFGVGFYLFIYFRRQTSKDTCFHFSILQTKCLHIEPWVNSACLKFFFYELLSLYAKQALSGWILLINHKIY